MVGCLGVAAIADTPGKHPHYLHALSDLREARAWVGEATDATVSNKQADTIAAIDRAIADIKGAAIDDGKALDDHPPVDAKMKHRDALKKALSLLNSANKDLRFKEDNQDAAPWRHSAFHDIADAIKADKQTMKLIREE
jgi:hypothetical protein